MKFKVLIAIGLTLFNQLVFSEVTLIKNVKGYSINNNELVVFNSMAFEFGKVLEIGSSDKLVEKYPGAKLIDGNGLTLLPGLHDANTDITLAAKSMVQVDLRGIKTKQEALDKIKQFIDDHPKKRWIEGFGWDHTIWKKPVYPTKHDLDSIDTDTAIWIKSKNNKIGWANSRTIHFTRAAKYKTQPKSGQIIFNKQGKHTGIYIDYALNIIQPHITQITPIESYPLLIKQMNKLASLGITSINEKGIDNKTYNALRSLANRSQLPIRINAPLTSADKAFDGMLTYGHYHREHQFLHTHSIKYFIDGDIVTQEALLYAPYDNDKTNTGTVIQPLNYLSDEIEKNTQLGWQILLQANGDKGTNDALKLLSNKNIVNSTFRNRITGASLLTEQALINNSIEHLFLSVNPYEAINNLPKSKTLLGEGRSKNLHVWNSLSKTNAKMMFGSNFPIENANPFLGMQAAATRKNNKTNKTYNASEKMNMTQILASYSINQALANRQESSLGSLEAFKWADFILVDQDIFNIDANDISKTNVIQTWVAGNKIFEKETD